MLPYWCHSCNKRVLLPPPEGDLICPVCGGDILEELEQVVPAQQTVQPPPRQGNPNPGFEILNFSLNVLNPFLFGQGQNSGNPAGGSFAVGDFVFGNLNDFMNRLMEMDANHWGSPPTAKETIESLPHCAITSEQIDSGLECVVCMDAFNFGEYSIKLPCNHYFHENCINPWLKKHSTCPICRYPLPTAASQSSSSSSSSSSTEASPSNLPASSQSSTNTPFATVFTNLLSHLNSPNNSPQNSSSNTNSHPANSRDTSNSNATPTPSSDSSFVDVLMSMLGTPSPPAADGRVDGSPTFAGVGTASTAAAAGSDSGPAASPQQAPPSAPANEHGRQDRIQFDSDDDDEPLSYYS